MKKINGCILLKSYPGLISGGFGKGLVKLDFPTSQYVSSMPFPLKKKKNITKIHLKI